MLIPLGVTSFRAFRQLLIEEVASWKDIKIDMCCKYLGVYIGLELAT